MLLLNRVFILCILWTNTDRHATNHYHNMNCTSHYKTTQQIHSKFIIFNECVHVLCLCYAIYVRIYNCLCVWLLKHNAAFQIYTWILYFAKCMKTVQMCIPMCNVIQMRYNLQRLFRNPLKCVRRAKSLYSPTFCKLTVVV